MAYLYAVTSHKPTAISFSVVCSFTSADERNLIVACNNSLKIYTFKETGLQTVAEVPIFGRIKALEVYRSLSSHRDALFVLIERKRICLLEFDPVSKQVITKAKADAHDRIGRDTEMGQRALIDPEGRLLGLMLYTGFIKVNREYRLTYYFSAIISSMMYRLYQLKVCLSKNHLM
jgi:DNA damage-binding protein 1